MPNDCSECKQTRSCCCCIQCSSPKQELKKCSKAFFLENESEKEKKLGMIDLFHFFQKNLKLQKMKTKRSKESETNRSKFFFQPWSNHSRFLKIGLFFSYFRLLLITIGRKLFNDALRGIEPRSSGDRSDRSTNWLA